MIEIMKEELLIIYHTSISFENILWMEESISDDKIWILENTIEL